MLSFFEDKSLQITENEGIEILQWSTTIQANRMLIPEIRVIIFIPLSYWTVNLVYEWRYLTNKSGKLSFYKEKSYTFPAVSLISIVGVLLTTDRVFCHHDSKNSEAKMKDVIMTQRQVFRHLEHVSTFPQPTASCNKYDGLKAAMDISSCNEFDRFS